MNKTILVTGASGFIGQRLTKSLLTAGFRVRCLVRHSIPLPPQAETVSGDLLAPETLPAALEGIDTAYYLVHSMADGRRGFEERERRAAPHREDRIGELSDAVEIAVLAEEILPCSHWHRLNVGCDCAGSVRKKRPERRPDRPALERSEESTRR